MVDPRDSSTIVKQASYTAMTRGKRSSCAVLLLLFTVLVLPGATNKTNEDSCGLQCKVLPGKKKTKCTLTADPLELNCSSETYSSNLQSVTSLDLSDNKLSQVPSKLFPSWKSVTELYLSRNNIKEIKSDAFKYLENLKFLNMSFNDIREWKVNLNNDLQSLTNIDVTGNRQWLPSASEQLFQLKNLTKVRGLTVTKHCGDCLLVKIGTKATQERLLSRWLWYDQIQYGKALDFLKVGFIPMCLDNKKCSIEQYELPLYLTITDVYLKGLYFMCAAGSIALLLNITVVLVILFNRSLRGDLAVCLVLHNAVCDGLISLFSLSYVRFNFYTITINYLYDQLKGNYYDRENEVSKYFSIMAPILTCVLLTLVLGSFMMTLEKCLKVVFAMKPNVRIGKRCAGVFLFASWTLSFCIALLPVFTVGMDYTELAPSSDSYGDVAFIVLGVFIAIQIASCILYVPIFIVARRSAANVGIKREATIAKKIALLVFTNLIFFITPAVVWSLESKMFVKYLDDVKLVTEAQWIFFAEKGLLLCCISINSTLNPLLYGLRHPKIKQQVDKILGHCKTVLSNYFVDLGHHLQCNSNADQQQNEMEMQGEN